MENVTLCHIYSKRSRNTHGHLCSYLEFIGFEKLLETNKLFGPSLLLRELLALEGPWNRDAQSKVIGQEHGDGPIFFSIHQT